MVLGRAARARDIHCSTPDGTSRVVASLAHISESVVGPKLPLENPPKRRACAREEAAHIGGGALLRTFRALFHKIGALSHNTHT